MRSRKTTSKDAAWTVEPVTPEVSEVRALDLVAIIGAAFHRIQSLEAQLIELQTGTPRQFGR